MCKKLKVLILFAFALSVGQTSRTEAANLPGLIGWWKLDEISGTTALDSSGLGNHGEFGPEGNPLRVPGVFGGAVELDGNFAYIEINSIADHLTANVFSVSAWINTTQTDDGTVIGSNGTGGGHEFIFGVDQGLLLVEEDGFNLYPPVINDGEWHHIAYTRDLTTGFGYSDGVLVGTAPTTGNPAGQARWSIGQEWDPPVPSDEFIGIVDDVQFFDRLLSAEEVVLVMVGTPPGEAADPTPAHEEPDASRDVILGWEPGEFAETHNVYFGTDFDAVNAAAPDSPMDVLASSGQEANSFDPARLEFGQTYFWRVDEVNGAPDFAVFAGNVWQFTVEPMAIPIPSVTVSASSTFGVSVPEKTVDGSGMADDLHGVAAADMWISGGLPATIEYAFDRAYMLHAIWIWNANQLIEGFVGFGAKDVVMEHSLDGANWTVLEGVSQLAQAPGTEGYVHNNTIDVGGITARYVRITITSVHGIAPQASLSEVRFFSIPTFATRPNPVSGATNVAPDASLSWGRNGREAGRHEVYVGADPNNLPFAGGVSESSFDTLALDLQLGQSYAWRVDEVNEAMDPSTWEGTVWSFTTADTVPIDDMESYRDEEFLEIWATWVDGFDDPANNGSVVGGAAGIPETGIVHGGRQSLPMDYDNRSASVSEATRTFDAPMDWTGHGVQSLVLYLNRGTNNTGGGRVYVKINDTKVVYEGDLPPGWDLWTQWTIDLSAVADATSVRSLTIGVEGAGAMGVLYVDSIQLVENAPAAFQPLSWFEAESGALTAPMQVFADSPTASAGQYIGTINGSGDETVAPSADGVATYSFDVPEDGVYQLAIRVIVAPGSNNNSFWLRIPGMATNTTNDASGWVRFNDITDGAAWHWDEVRSSDDGDSVVEFTLAAGTHTLEIARREDGALLDAIAVMN